MDPAGHHSASKLPIKRKTPDPNQQSDSVPPPPLKFHRIWTEPDEIRFLQGLLDCSSNNLSFPRDLGIFYSRFSNTMSQPYTKSQLSEKLRRLRKKFRVISTRLAKGLDRSQLSIHDRALFDLSKQLWHPDYAATSPFNGARNVGGFGVSRCSSSGGGGGEKGGKSGLVGIKVDFSPTIPAIASGGLEFDEQENVGNGGFDEDEDDVRLELDCLNDEIVIHGEGITGGVVIGRGSGERKDHEVKLSEVNVELEEGDIAMVDNVRDGVDEGKSRGVAVGDIAAKAVMGVFEESFEDVRRKRIEHRIAYGERLSVEVESFHVRWQKQRIAEFDVLGKRLRLLLEHSLGKP